MEDKEQKPFEPGMYVSYVPGFKSPENGRIKSISGNHIFVVYHCNGEWGHYKDYTGVNTPREELQHGWRDKDGITIKTPEN
jgi:hypothetical protein